jgi:hypothetical protein
MQWYSGALVTAMSTDYRIEPVGNQFIVVDPWGEQVDRYPTEDAARQDIERCKKEDAMWETAKLLVDAAIKAHIQIHDVDRETARYWVFSAAEATD